MEIKYILNIYIKSQSAEATPPLGTVLGNLGVNAIKFCKDFNEETKDLPSYFVVGVRIHIFESRNYKFFITGLPLSPMINYVRYERIVKIHGRSVTEHCIKLSDILLLSLFRFPGLPLKKSFPILFGCIQSFGLLIVKD